MEAEPVEGWHYDGRSAVRQRVRVWPEGGLLHFEHAEAPVALADLQPMGDRARAVFGLRGVEGWRLGFDGPVPEALARALPRQEHHGGILDRIGIVRAVLAGAVLAAAAVFLLVQGTSLLARLIPERWEVAFGETLTGDFGGETCTTPAGQRALDSLARRLDAHATPVRIRVIDLRIVNAAALPGRQIVIFRGLLDAANSPDEIAGVLGHEIGHVENRDAMTALLRDFGLGILIGGGHAGGMAQSLLSSRYGRSAERGADSFALTALNRADISPRDTARFFGRLAKGEATLGRAATAMSYMASHPLSEERRKLFADGVRKAPAYRPALPEPDWTALKTICGPEDEDDEERGETPS